MEGGQEGRKDGGTMEERFLKMLAWVGIYIHR